MASYRHTQPGYVIIVCLLVCCGVVLLLGSVMRDSPARPPAEAMLAIFVAVSVLFCSLTIEIRDKRLYWWFGPGLINKSVALDDIANVLPWKMRGLGAWGIHWGPQGWLYNVSGRQGVVIVLKNGKKFILGTDEPERLIAALRMSIGHDEAA